jgi:hypothetical protein
LPILRDRQCTRNPKNPDRISVADHRQMRLPPHDPNEGCNPSFFEARRGCCDCVVELNDVSVGHLENPEMPAKSDDAPPGGAIVRNLLREDDAMQVQRRLAELGFLSGSADGKWGPRSKRALLEFKEQSRLDKNDLWDAATERSLFNNNATHAVSTLPFVGGWTLRLGECGEPGQPSPVRITSKRAETSGGACDAAFVGYLTAQNSLKWR